MSPDSPYVRKEVPIHPWRWRAITIWIICFTLIVMFSLHRISQSRARESALEQTNCGLKRFLITAEVARRAAADRETADGAEAAAKLDRQAANGYAVLAAKFTAVGKHCSATPVKAVHRPKPKKH